MIFTDFTEEINNTSNNIYIGYSYRSRDLQGNECFGVFPLTKYNDNCYATIIYSKCNIDYAIFTEISHWTLSKVFKTHIEAIASFKEFLTIKGIRFASNEECDKYRLLL